MGKIFCVMGKSSSGKDTIFKRLIADRRLGLRPVIPYTTRPIRLNETHGVEYFFIDEAELERQEGNRRIIEKRCYETVNGRWTYCTIDDGQIDLAQNKSYLLITTLPAYRQLQEYFGRDMVVPLYIAVEDGRRLARAMRREQRQEKPNYEEVCRRFLADSQDFSQERLQECGIHRHYSNEKLSLCLQNVKKAISAALARPARRQEKRRGQRIQ